MTTRPTDISRAPDAVTEEAIAWFVRTHSDQRTSADEDRFAQWLKQDPRHAQTYARIEKVWRAAGPEIKPRPLSREHDEGPAARKPPGRPAWIAGLAAAVVVVAIGTTYLMKEQPVSVTRGTFATEAGAQRALALADGSTITLNTRSEVSVHLGERQRSIRLVRGEARFQVAKDPTRPFIVDAGAARVRAVGTAFDVRVSAARVAVTLVEGRIEVMPTLATIKVRDPAVLTAGQQVSYEIDTGERHIMNVNVERTSAWIRQQLVFDSVPLAAAVEEANRYLEVPIAVDDPTIADIRVSGVVRAGNVESFIGSLESSFPVEAIEGADGRLALVRRSRDQTR